MEVFEKGSRVGERHVRGEGIALLVQVFHGGGAENDEEAHP